MGTYSGKVMGREKEIDRLCVSKRERERYPVLGDHVTSYVVKRERDRQSRERKKA